MWVPVLISLSTAMSGARPGAEPIDITDIEAIMATTDGRTASGLAAARIGQILARQGAFATARGYLLDGVENSQSTRTLQALVDTTRALRLPLKLSPAVARRIQPELNRLGSSRKEWLLEHLAESLGEPAKASLLAQLGPTSSRYGAAQYRLGVLAARRKPERALGYFAAAREWAKDRSDDDALLVGGLSELAIARVRYGSGDYRGALEIYEAIDSESALAPDAQREAHFARYRLDLTAPQRTTKGSSDPALEVLVIKSLLDDCRILDAHKQASLLTEQLDASHVMSPLHPATKRRFENALEQVRREEGRLAKIRKPRVRQRLQRSLSRTRSTINRGRTARSRRALTTTAELRVQLLMLQFYSADALANDERRKACGLTPASDSARADWLRAAVLHGERLVKRDPRKDRPVVLFHLATLYEQLAGLLYAQRPTDERISRLREQAKNVYDALRAKDAAHRSGDEFLLSAALNDLAVGNVESARRALEQLLEAHGDSRLAYRARLHLGDFAFARGDFRRAASLYAVGGEEDEASRLFADYSLAWCDFGLGDLTSAKRRMTEVARRAEALQQPKMTAAVAEALAHFDATSR